MLEVTLYTKEGCGLCDDVKVELARLATVYPHHLKEVDITQDVDIFDSFRYAIPVVQIGRSELRAPITDAELASALASASSFPCVEIVS